LQDETGYASPIQLKDSVSGLDSGLFNCTYALLAIGFNALLFLFLNPETDYLFLTTVNILAAISFHLIILAQKRYKFRYPINNYELESLLTKAKDRLDISRNIELWLIDDDGFVLVHTTNLLFSSIIMSNQVITKLLENPVFGEIIIADEALRIENGPRKFSFMWDFMHYSLFSIGVYLFEGAIFPFLVSFGAIVLQTVIILMSLVLLSLPIQQRRATASPHIGTIYGVTRIEAEKEVFGNIDRGFFQYMGSSSRPRINESSEFRIGMIPIPLAIFIICAFVIYIIFNTILSVVSERLPFIVIPLSILFATFGFYISFELINPTKYEVTEVDTSSDDLPFEDEQTATFAELLHEIPQYAEIQARKRKVWGNRIIMTLGHSQDPVSKLASLSETAINHLEPEELLVYALAQLKRNEVSRNQDKWGWRLLKVVTPLIIVYGFYAIFISHYPFMEFVILLLFLYAGLIFAIFAIIGMRTRSKMEQIDIETQRKYPSLYTILEKLQDKGYSYEMKMHKERFEYLLKYTRNRNHPSYQTKHHH